jgi:phosphoribosyl 1,2-cyclic phosphodiesterase
MKVWTLGTGSSGNATLVEADDTRLLVDAGFPRRELGRRLASIGVAPESIQAAVITHEHGDHICGARTASRRWKWRLHATPGTALEGKLDAERTSLFQAGDTFPIGGIDVQAVRSSHDAADPVLLVLTDRRTGARAGIAYDLGRASSNVVRALCDLEVLVLESNHDELMLATGPYPPMVQRRIASARGHLSNSAAAELAQSVVNRGLRHIALAHLSQKCNTPALALQAMRKRLERTRFRGRVTATTQDGVHGPFTAAGPQTGIQLSLTL